MATQFEIDCALMAGVAYRSTRPDPKNRLPVPDGWIEIPLSHVTQPSGFEAVAFQSQCSNDIVISFAGTYPGSAGDLAADAELANGIYSDQVIQAAEYYLQVKAANPGANITITGHSLGGGLAALIGVFFGEAAVTFDQAPFRKTAETSILPGNPSNGELLKYQLSQQGYSEAALSGLTNFLQSQQINGGVPNSDLVSDFTVQGEFLTSTFPFSAYSKIGTSQTLLHGTPDAWPLDLHLEELLTTFELNDPFRQVTFKLPDLERLMFDANLYNRSTASGDENFITRLVRHQVGMGSALPADAMLDRFTADLQKIAQDSGLTVNDGNPGNSHLLSNALIAFAMQKYYDEKTGNIGLGATLFQDVNGGIQFDTDAVVGEGRSITSAKGYTQYFQQYLDTTSLLSPEERGFINAILPQLRDWYVQSGASGMNATDTLNRGAFMLGGTGSDTLTGGTANDLFVGNAGNDTLDGGAGADTMMGGANDDTYIVDNTGDVIVDKVNEGIDLVKSSVTYTLAENLENLTLTGSNAINATGNALDNIITGNSEVNTLNGGAGNDTLTGGAGNDTLIGGDGADTLNGGTGTDTYYADNGDTISDEDGSGRIYVTSANLLLTGGSRQAGDPYFVGSVGGQRVVYTEAGDGTIDVFVNDTHLTIASAASGGGSAPSASGGGSAPSANGDVISGMSGHGVPLTTHNNGLGSLIPAIQDLVGQAAVSPSPLILDLNGDGATTLSKAHNIRFDHDGNGFAEQTGWVAPSDGLLVWDRNGNRQIDGGSELFGNNTVLASGSKAANGFAALAELDSNADGKVDANDANFSQLRVWKDSDSNAIASLGELLTLDTAGVQSIGVSYTQQTVTDAQGNQHNQAGHYTATDGTSHSIDDVWFDIDYARTIDQNLVAVDATIEALPDVPGFGNVHSLHQAMARDTSGHLQSLVQQFAAATDPVSRQSLTVSILYAWAGVENVTPNSPGYLSDARFVCLEIFLGQNYVGWLQIAATSLLAEAFGQLASYVTGQLNAQTQFKSLYDSIGLVLNATTGQFELDVAPMVSTLRALFDANPATGPALMDEFAASLKSCGTTGQDVLDKLPALGDPAATGFLYQLFYMGWSVLNGTGSADVLYGSNGVTNRIHGLDGSDTLYGGDQTDHLTGGAGNDILYGRVGNDVLNGDDGDDTLNGGAGNDVLDGGAGNDMLNGDIGNDTYIFGRGAGQDTLIDNDPTVGNVDTVHLTGLLASEITLIRELDAGGNDTSLLIKINGTTDTLRVQNFYASLYCKIEKIVLDDGTTWNATDLLNLTFLPIGDSVYGTTGTDTFDLRNAANTTANGYAGNDTYLFGRGSGQDTIKESDSIVGNVDTVRLTGLLASEITLIRELDASGNDTHLLIKVNDTTDTLRVLNFYGGSLCQIEKIVLDDGTTWNTADLLNLTFLPTGDSVYGTTTGTDTFDLRNAANTTVNGYAGNDTYLFGRGSGQDTINDSDSAAGNVDTVRLTGLLASEFTLVRELDAGGNDTNLLIKINDTSDTLRVQYFYSGSLYQIEKIILDDGTTWNTADLLNLTLLPTGATANGAAGADTFDLRNAANTTANGYAGNDTYLFGHGSGQDTIKEFDSIVGNVDTVRLTGLLASEITLVRELDAGGNDTNLLIKINDTSDTLRVQYFYSGSLYQIEKIVLDDGTTWNTADLLNLNLLPTGATANGAAGADTFDLRNAANTTANGYAGNDTYLFGRGSGQDVIVDSDTTVGNVDTVRFATDVSPGDVTYWRDQSNLYFKINGTTDILTVKNWYSSTSTNYHIEKVEFSDGTVWSDATLQAGAIFYGTSGNDTMNGTAQSDTLIGLAGDDTLTGNGGNDTLDGGAGNDVLNGGTVSAGAGNDTYVFGRGYGQDVIFDSDTTVGNVDTVRFAADVSPGDVTYWRDQSNLYFKINGTTDTLTVKNWYSSTSTNYHIEKVEFADGTVWSDATLQAGAIFYGTSGTDTMNGTAQSDTLIGLAGDDTLTGNGGNDTLDGGAGNDVLNGGTVSAGAGNDTYVFGRGYGQDVIVDSDTTVGNVDTVRFAADVIPGDVTYWRDQSNLYFKINGTTDTLTVKNWYSSTSTNYHIEKVEFADGTVWSDATLQAGAIFYGTSGTDTMNGSAQNDTLIGQAGNDTLAGNGGIDLLQGGAGDDTLKNTSGKSLFDGGAGADILTGSTGKELFIGGAGNDTITTGTGADIIAFNQGDGQDTVVASTGADNILSLGGGINYQNLAMSKSSYDLILSTGSGDQITMKNWFSGTTNRSIANLQIVLDASAYNSSSTDPLLNQQIQSFDFALLAQNFDQALAANPALTSWSMTDALLSAHLSGSDTAALGGDLAYQYNLNGTLAGIGVAAAQAELGDASFGVSPQLLQPLAGLQTGTARLN